MLPGPARLLFLRPLEAELRAQFQWHRLREHDHVPSNVAAQTAAPHPEHAVATFSVLEVRKLNTDKEPLLSVTRYPNQWSEAIQHSAVVCDISLFPQRFLYIL